MLAPIKLDSDTLSMFLQIPLLLVSALLMDIEKRSRMLKREYLAPVELSRW